MTKKLLPTQQYLQECFHYDDTTGICTWKERPSHHFTSEIARKQWNNKHANNIIKFSLKSNYYYIHFNNTTYSIHRLIWKYVTGNEPIDIIDHIDNDTSNNKFENLRAVSISNSNKNRTRVSKYKKGVTYRVSTNRYRPQIRDNGKVYELGSFLTEDEAYAAYCTAARHLHGEYANYGNHEPIFNDELPPILLWGTQKGDAILPLEFINECVSYNEETGELSWKRRPYHHYNSGVTCNTFNRNNEGLVITGIAGNGYINFAIDGYKYYAHRIIWKIMTGEDPVGTIEHIDGNKLNNKFENLRISEVGKRNNKKTELSDVSVEYLKECIEYDPETGLAYWKERPLHHFKNSSNMKSVNKNTGKPIDMINSHGYIRFTINYSTYLLHRVIWKLITGEDSEHLIDHIDGNKLNNKWDNLREATVGQNACNKKISSHNTTGYKGVSVGRTQNTWVAVIRLDGKVKKLGTFPTPEDAHQAYCEAASAYHGEFANYG